MGNGDVLAVAAALPHGGDGTVGKAADLRPSGGADVNTIVEPLLSLHRVLPVAEIRGEGAHHRGAVIKAQQGLFQAHVVRQVLVGVEDVGQGRRLRRALGCGFRSLRCLIGLCCLRGLCRLGCCCGQIQPAVAAAGPGPEGPQGRDGRRKLERHRLSPCRG